MADCYSSLILTLATHQERNENTHQEKNKTWSSRKKQDPTVKVNEVPYKTFKTFLIINLIIGELYYE